MLLRRRTFAAAILGVLAALACSAPSALAAPVISVKAAKHADGPFKGDDQPVKVASGKTKTLYWKVKNNSEDPRDLLFLDGPEEAPSGYEVSWRRGREDITSDVEGSGYEFSLGSGDVAIFRAKVKRTSADEGFCLTGQAGAPFDGVNFAVNGPCG